ncbi:hypothetical protein FRC03_004114 [Tulasnella sp. 419]|nr:hypothetical protein FRC03_004114 [Tulasnella sp. 419]
MNKLINRSEDKSKRKAKDSDKYQTLLPPGLYNHHNTCFFNSTLQAIIATSLVERLITFQYCPTFRYPISPTPIASGRSPALTNARGGVSERSRVNTMPLCDAFIAFNKQAYYSRDSRARDALSPRYLLNCLGSKYGQYLDFRQQDAHELLRQLLDGMQMEELDEIKRRQPPRPVSTRGQSKSTNASRVGTIPSTDGSSEHLLPPISEEEKLYPFVDMLFGGKLASILVCEGCKHVSHTYEDFMDLSLSLKVEEKDRKKHILKQFAQKFRKTQAPPTPPPISVTSDATIAPKPVPATSPPFTDRHPLPPFFQADIPRPSSVPPSTPFFTELNPLDELRRRSAEYPPADRGSAGFSQPSESSSHPINPVSTPSPVTPDFRSSSPQLPENPTNSSLTDLGAKISRKVSTKLGIRTKDRSRSRGPLQTHDESIGSTVSLHSDSEAGPVHAIADSLSALNPARLKPLSPVRALSVGSRASTARSKAIKKRRADKAAREQAYLRAVLRDEPHGNAQALWKMAAAAALGQSGLEDCLRQFTAVESLDGENSFACKRCWRKANPSLAALERAQRTTNPNDSRSSDDDSTTDYSSDDDDAESSYSIIDPTVIPLPASRPLTPTALRSFDSQPSQRDGAAVDLKPSPTSKPTKYGGLPIPAISTTSPESPDTVTPPVALLNKLLSSSNTGPYLSPNPSRNSIEGSSKRVPVKQPRASSDADSSNSSEDSEKEVESTTSVTTGSNTDINLQSPAPTDHGPVPKELQQTLPPKSQRVIHRRALKRYLISAPPPVLVIHLKRFQQITKSHSMFANFKKLDDYVAFPEYLDLKSFIAPRREDFGLKGDESRQCNPGRGRTQVQTKHEWWRLGQHGETLEEPKVVYRLQAVVVHIGSMLGGHYIAYTALSPGSALEQSISNTSGATDGDTARTETKSISSTEERKWCFVSDTTVRLATIEEVLKAKAYLCFYERVY